VPGKLTVLVGASGSGKSTLINLIMRQLLPESGDILIDGKSYDELTLSSLRAQFAVMLQQHHLFSGTLRNALWLKNQIITDDKIWEALSKVDMEKFVRQLPEGLATELDEDGCNFSGGQRARLSLARALLQDRPILLLDEPLANIDEQSQKIFLKALDKIRQYKTCLVISHLPALIERAELLLHLNNGQLQIQQSKPTSFKDKRESHDKDESFDILL
jgi:ABC-type bacteriocin/lantibiotic exporter with double-glycine peptidase domain